MQVKILHCSYSPRCLCTSERESTHLTGENDVSKSIPSPWCACARPQAPRVKLHMLQSHGSLVEYAGRYDCVIVVAVPIR